MNLRILPTPVMLAITDHWVNEAVIRDELMAHPIGAAMHTAIEHVHEALAEQQNLRARIRAQIAEHGAMIAHLSGVYARKARALHDSFAVLENAADDPDSAARFGKLRALLFPGGLRILKGSHIAQAGVIEQLERRVTPAIIEALAGVRVGAHTLAELYRAWVEAGRALGRRLHERARLKASIARQGTAAARSHAQPVRVQWIRMVRALLSTMPLMPLSDAARENLLAPLELGVANALRRRGQAVPDGLDDDLDDDLGDLGGDLDVSPDDGLDGDLDEPGERDDLGDPGVLDALSSPTEPLHRMPERPPPDTTLALFSD